MYKKLIEMHQRNTNDLHTRLNAEIERNHALEQLVKDYRELLLGWDAIRPAPRGVNPNAYTQQYRAAEARYRAVFGEQEKTV